MDLGKQNDYTALTILDWTEANPQTPQPTFHVRAIKRWAPGTPYPAICDWLVKFVQTPDPDRKGEPPPVLVLDETGVGAAVYAMIYAALCTSGFGWMIGVTITGGSVVGPPVNGHWPVAKMQLASVLMALFQSRRLNIATLPETEVLLREAEAFTVKVMPSGNGAVESWREGANDGLVFSLAIACWAAMWIDWPRQAPWPLPPPPPQGFRPW